MSALKPWQLFDPNKLWLKPKPVQSVRVESAFKSNGSFLSAFGTNLNEQVGRLMFLLCYFKGLKESVQTVFVQHKGQQYLNGEPVLCLATTILPNNVGERVDAKRAELAEQSDYDFKNKPYILFFPSSLALVSNNQVAITVAHEFLHAYDWITRKYSAPMNGRIESPIEQEYERRAVSLIGEFANSLNLKPEAIRGAQAVAWTVSRFC